MTRIRIVLEGDLPPTDDDDYFREQAVREIGDIAAAHLTGLIVDGEMLA